MNQRVATHESAFFFVVLMGFCYLSKRKHRNVVFFLSVKALKLKPTKLFFFSPQQKEAVRSLREVDGVPVCR